MAKRKSENPGRGKTPLEWRRMDLHLHTPASKDFQEPGVSYLDMLQRAEQRGLDIMAFTDHNTVAGYRAMRTEIEQLELLERLGRLLPEEKRRLDEYRRLLNKILVLPGFEFTATFGFHILGIFGPDIRVRQLEHLLLKLNIPPDRLDLGATEVGVSSDVLTVYRLIREAGGIVIAAHANSANGVAMRGFSFGGQTKIAYTQDPNLHALEVTDLDQKGPRTTQSFFNGSKPEYPRRMRCIQGSDAHRLRRDPNNVKLPGLGDRITEVALPELTFDALKELFESDDWTRSRPYRGPAQEPIDEIRQAREVGPNIVQAFHDSISRRAGRLYSVIADVVAFANTNGGTLYIGCTPDPKTPPIGVEQPELTLEQLRHEIQSQITPPLPVNLDLAESEGKKIIRVVVRKGDEPPYALEQNRIYIRDEAETSLAARDEIVQLVKRGLGMIGAAIQSVAPAVTGLPIAIGVPSASAPVAEASQPEVIAPAAPAGFVPVPETHPPSPSVWQPAVASVEPTPVAATQPANETPIPAPRTGVEIVAVEERDGVRYHTMRDLRNGNVVRNVTKKSARKLWHYAIQRYDSSALDLNRMNWQGRIALLGSNTRQGQVRYDLAQRINGEIRVYFGVTEEGIHGPWKKLIGTLEEETAGRTAPAPEPAAGIVASPQPSIAAPILEEAEQAASATSETSSLTEEPLPAEMTFGEVVPAPVEGLEMPGIPVHPIAGEPIVGENGHREEAPIEERTPADLEQAAASAPQEARAGGKPRRRRSKKTAGPSMDERPPAESAESLPVAGYPADTPPTEASASELPAMPAAAPAEPSQETQPRARRRGSKRTQTLSEPTVPVPEPTREVPIPATSDQAPEAVIETPALVAEVESGQATEAQARPKPRRSRSRKVQIETD